MRIFQNKFRKLLRGGLMLPKSNKNSNQNFVQEYAYVELYPSLIPSKQDKDKKEDENRGVVIIDIFGDDEEKTS